MTKFAIYDNVESALEGCKSGSTVMVGGFGLSGIPENIIEYVRGTDITGLKIISTEAGDDDWGLARLYQKDKIAWQAASFIGRAHAMEKSYLEGRSTLELIPQGTLAEKVRGAAFGIPAFYTITGNHTLYADGKLPRKYNKDGSVAEYNKKREKRTFGDVEYLLEESFDLADFAWVKASKAVDKMGNCTFRGTSQNFNPLMAKASHCTIVEAEEIVEIGEIPPEEVHLPGLYVNRLFKGAEYKHKVEVLKVAEEDETKEGDKGGDDGDEDPRHTIAKRAAQEFTSGMNCNLGVGIPTLAAAYAAKAGTHVFLQSENGMNGVGGSPHRDAVDSDWINAGKETVTPVAGASTFDSAESFGQIRGGHLDMTVLGSLECSQYGDVANFMIPGKKVSGMGGAMDLVSAPKLTRVVVTQTHCDKHGRSKIKEQCDLPLTGAKVASRIITELAVFDVNTEKGLTLVEYNPKSSVEDIKKKTAAKFEVGKDCKAWKL